MVTTASTIMYHPNDPKPEAYIAINKNRVKVYSNNNVFLKDKQTFQIELFNPTRKDILAEIYINSSKIDGGGIILRPGERVFLERYLTENRRFMFSTYTASGTNEQLKHALHDNGLIKVEFHREKEVELYNGMQNFNYNIKTPNFDMRKLSKSRGVGGTAKGVDYDAYRGTMDMLYCDNMSQQVNFCSSTISSQSFDNTIKEVETGKIEKGSASDQSFIYVDKDFEPAVFATAYYKLLPVSQQKFEGKDIYKVRRYCENCGNKVTSKAKFCTNCGIKL